MANTQETKKALNISLLSRLFLGLIAFYRYAISPLFPSRCRYYPTCSSYAKQAIIRYGALYGAWLTLKRLSRCHPWGGYGYDPLPDEPSNSSTCCDR